MLHILEKLIVVAMKGVPCGSQNEFGNLYQVCVSVFGWDVELGIFERIRSEGSDGDLN